jgi:hypothetical protein
VSLALSFREQEDFFVGDIRFVIEAIHSDSSFRLRRVGDGRIFEINVSRAIEILPGVFASAGHRSQTTLARIAIDAPRHVCVLRGRKYREGLTRARGTPPRHAG